MRIAPTLIIAALAGLAVAGLTYLTAGAEDGPKAEVAIPVQPETAIFAGGCFWCVESDFDKVAGVVSTTSGYIGGTTDNPTYKNHTADGHYEAVEIVYDATKVSYRELVDYFYRHVDPTDAGGQFCDRGDSYRTAIFALNAEQRAAAEAETREITASGVLSDPIVTPIIDAPKFYAAETYHQDYYTKNPLRYRYYRNGCGRDKRVAEVWAKERATN